MIRLYGFGQAFGMPDPSPFVIKTEVLLKMAGLPYELKRGDFKTNPKGKMPYIEDNGQIVGDSTLIRMHLEQKHGIDFDKGAARADVAAAWAFEKMCEDHLYWMAVRERWMDDANFERGPLMFFKSIPGVIRPLITGLVRRKIRRNLFGQGFGRFSEAEGLALVQRTLGEINAYLETRAFLGGDAPCGSDAALFAFMYGAIVPQLFIGPVSNALRQHPAIAAYAERMRARYYPDRPVA